MDYSETGYLMSNILNNSIQYSNCRLCLKEIDDKYVCFKDEVYLESGDHHSTELAELIAKFLGNEALEDIPGFECACLPCVDKILDFWKFSLAYNKCTDILKSSINKLSAAIEKTHVDGLTDHRMYVVCTTDNCLLEVVPNIVQDQNMRIALSSCNQCDLKFNNAKELQDHNLLSHQCYSCHRCNRIFDKESQLHQHNELNHLYQCPECPNIKPTKSSLNIHIENHHKPFICNECNKTFIGRENLKKHLDAYHSSSIDRNKKCPKCGKTYLTFEFYLRHTELCLSGKIEPHPIRNEMHKSFQCTKCNKGYSTPGGLRVHTKFVHGDAKQHICEHCGKSFSAPSYLKTHMIKHTRERNFTCDICQNKFVTKEALLYHTRRHTGEKPYSCKLCDQKFVNASSRAEHVKYKHIGPRFECGICNRKFVTESYLQKHMLRHIDRSSKLFVGRSRIPPNVPGPDNMRVELNEDSTNAA